jgi:hypothetical protein
MRSGRVALAGLAAGYMLWAQTVPTSAYKTDRRPVTISYEQPNALGVSYEVYYYRSDGSFAHTHLLPGNTKAPQVEVIDLRNKVTFLKDPATQLYDDLPLTQRVYDDYRHTPASCEASLTTPKSQTCSPLGNEQMLGYRVQKVTTVPSNKPDMSLESWIAPDLDFVPLLQVRHRDGKATTIRRAINVQPGEPDESVFALPANYRRVAKSSEFVEQGSLARGLDNPFPDDASRQKLDEVQTKKRADGLLHKVQ